MQLNLDDFILKSEPIQVHWFPQKDHHKLKKKKENAFGLWDIIKIGIVVLSSFLIGNIFTNAGLYTEKLEELIHGVTKIHTVASTDSVAFAQSKKKQYLDSLFAKNNQVKKNIKEEIYDYYNTKSRNLERQFNTLPPDRRIVIADIWTQAPIITVEGDIEEKMKEWEFKEELRQGVTHYPTTPDPSQSGTMMIVGHTSNYFRVKSAYNTIFSKIPQLKVWNSIKVYWDGKEYEYVVKEQRVISPKDVPSEYAKLYDPNDRKLILMWCYPVGSNASRVLIIAEPKEKRVQINAPNLAFNPSKWNISP